MLGRLFISPWLIAVLHLVPLAVVAQGDPFAESGQADVDVVEQPGDSGPAETDGDGGKGPEQQAGGQGESEVSADTDNLEDEYGFDPAEEFASEQEPGESDPWEGANRAVFRFNTAVDSWVLKPVATSYRQITPIFMQRGVSNFFGNLREVTSVINGALQWKWGQVGNDAGRFVVNSTVGVVGLFDVAQHMGLERGDGEDFAQTLAVWGVPAGPYVVLPLLGPSTVRDAPALVVDYYTNPMNHVDHDQTRYALQATDLVEIRASLLDVETLLKGDQYVLLRDAYLQRREYLINDGNLEDDFGEEDDFGDEEDDFGSDTDEDPF
ncbi:MlaA family lipoprotein [Microbulbifer sp. TYP-18]|uniref:MlaA family lipoprotein n=1 Tax=Microbulbifer sp. TYP-18 TaxID=3230024 RepID=UPI0034C5E921